MVDFRPDQQLEAQEFEAATTPTSKWQKMPRPKFGRVDRSWFTNKWLIGLAIFLVILFGGRWVYHVITKDDNVSAPTPVAIQDRPTQSTQSPTPNPRPSQIPTQMPNTGPGDTAAIFVSAAVVAGSVHYVVTSRKTR